MRVLVLGGTIFLGRHVVEAALARGDQVTVFTRGRGQAPGGVTSLVGDRDGGLDALREGTWDAVVDTSGYVPRVVRQSAELLRDRVGFYAFISTMSVYPMEQEDKSETAPVLELEDPRTEDIGSHYGALKAACERVVEEVYGHRALQVRSGLIAGPLDPTERVTYWAARGLRPGEVLAGGRPERLLCFVDARDQASWILEMAARGDGGVYNVQGPDIAFGHLLEACGIPDATWVPDRFLLDHEVVPFTGLPLWIPEGMGSLLAPADRARAAGLRCRPVSHTIRDLQEWVRTRAGVPQPQESGGRRRGPAGMAPEREAELLAAWHSEAG
ncbi:MAG: NAD-dependent epimerase/dehydratase family protein [Candidatus Dormibacteraeota bacterium]|nr:NAD-dependent epimerase/dehydratase family protein [Candidatus Dormibacteraeota bacterium]